MNKRRNAFAEMQGHAALHAGEAGQAAPLRASPHRRALLAKVHLAKKALGLDEDTYRAVLAAQCRGRTSLTELRDGELIALLGHFESKGWKPTGGKSARAQHPAARKARALWISLWHLGAVSSPSEMALEGFAKRQLKCDRLVWAEAGQMFKLVEALKKIGERAGWQQGKTVFASKLALLQVLLVRLKQAGLAEQHWNVALAARELAQFDKAQQTGPMGWEPLELDLVARRFGDLLRSAVGEQA